MIIVGGVSLYELIPAKIGIVHVVGLSECDYRDIPALIVPPTPSRVLNYLHFAFLVRKLLQQGDEVAQDHFGLQAGQVMVTLKMGPHW